MKTKSIIRLICLVLVVVVIAILAFVGNFTIYTTKLLNWGSAMRKTIETGSCNALSVSVADGNSDNKVDVKNAVSVLKARMEKSGYNATVVQADDTIRVEVADATSIYSADSVHYVSVYGIATTAGKISITDTSGNEIATGANIRSSRYNGYNSDTSAYMVQVQLDKAGTKALAKATSNGTYSIKFTMDTDTTATYTNSGKISNGKLTLSFDSSNAVLFAQVADCGVLNDTVSVGSTFMMDPAYGSKIVLWTGIATAAVLVLMMAYMIIRYRMNGVAGALSMLIAILLFEFFLAAFDSFRLDAAGMAGVTASLLLIFGMTLMTLQAIRQQYATGKLLSGALEDSVASVKGPMLDIAVTAVIGSVALWIVSAFWGLPSLVHFATAILGGEVIALVCAIFLPKHIIKIFIGCGISSEKALGLKRSEVK